MRKFHLRHLIISVFLIVTSLIFNATAVSALPVPNFCFAHADQGDRLHTMLFDGTGQQAAPNQAGVPDIESMAFNPSDQQLYAVDLDQLGTLNYDFTDAANGGRFTPVGPSLGSINGAGGLWTISDVDSLAFDPITNILYAVDRDDTAPDKLFIIDVATGTADPNGFGAGIGYIEVTDNNPATVWDEDIDDLAIDPTDAQLYAIANLGGAGDHLITLDRETGALTDIGILTTDDMEGLSFFNDGTLYGTTGAASSTTSERNTLWRINTSNAVATAIDNFSADSDYEAVACLVGDPNNKSGVVFNDANNNGVLDGGEGPLEGITIEIYRDTGILAGAIDAGDRRIGTAVTNASGTYQFDMAAIGEFILQVDIASLPAGISISDNIEIAIFDNCNPGALPFDDFGCAEPNNNFPSRAASAPTDTPTPTATSTETATPLPTATSEPPTAVVPSATAATVAAPTTAALTAAAPRIVQVNGVDVQIGKTVEPANAQIGDMVTFTITVTNPNAQAVANVRITDDVPSYFRVISATASQGTVTINGNRVTANIGTLQAQRSATITITAENIQVGFAPETCNQAQLGNGVSNSACPNIFPGELPQTGLSGWSRLRGLTIFLLLGIGVGVLFRQWRKRDNMN